MSRLHLTVCSIFCGVGLLFVVIPVALQENSPFPGLWAIACEVARSSERRVIFDALGSTFIRFAASTVIGCALGILLGVMQTHSRSFNRTISPWLVILRVTPAIVWISVLFVIPFPKNWIPVTVASLFSACYVSLPVQQALLSVSDSEHAYMIAQQVSRDWNWKMDYCYLPRILAATSTGVRVGGSIALVLVIVAEAITSRKDGMGYLLVNYQQTLEEELLWFIVILMAVLALLFFLLFNSLEKLAGGISGRMG